MNRQDIIDSFCEWKYRRGLTISEAARLLEFTPGYCARVFNRQQRPSDLFVTRALRLIERDKEREGEKQMY